MKRLADFVMHKWTLGILGLIGLSCIIWYGADYIKFGEANHALSHQTRLLIIGFFWCIWLAWQLANWLLERRQNAALINSLQAEQEPASPDEARSQEELEAIATRFKDALAQLRKARFRRGGRALSLYQLPWYIIIGPPGAGKTTALVNSGLEFPLAQGNQQLSVGGVGGTRNCDWWFTNDAVLIDTAGRYTTQDSHRTIDNTAWHAFIDLLRKHRKRRPINGALLAISLQDLMVQTSEQRAHQAKVLRSRINELHQQFGIRFPIYLTFTKCDLVAGFGEFFANLSQAEREQVWGVSFAAEAENDQAIKSFGPEFDALVDRLNQRLLWRVQQERNIDRRALLQAFPARMETLSDVVTDFVKQTFSANRYDTPPLLRGVYFTSATQEGSPIDRMMASVSANFGLERDMGKAQANTGKSYFLTRLLQDVIFPESELVGVNQKLESTLVWGRRAVFAALALVTAGTLLAWTASLTQNKLQMADVSREIAAFNQLEPGLNRNAPDLPALTRAFDHLSQAAAVYNQQEHPGLSSLGLYDPRVDQAADNLYRHKLNTLLYPLIANTLARDTQGNQHNDNQLLDSLRVYLSLFQPDKRDNNRISNHLKSLWEPGLSGQSAQLAALVQHADQTLAEPTPAFLAEDQQLVSQSRQALARVPVPRRVFQQLTNSALASHQVSLSEALGLAEPAQLGLDRDGQTTQVAVLYTKTGYQQLDFSADSPLLTQLAEDQWLYGDARQDNFTEADRARIAQQVEKLYMARYVETWRTLLQGIELEKLRSTAQAIDRLEQWSDPVNSPLLALIQVAADNTRLTETIDADLNAGGAARLLGGRTARAAALGDKALDAVNARAKPTPVDLQFQDLQRLTQGADSRPSRMQEYLGSLEQIKEMLVAMDNAPDSDEAAFNLAKARFADGGNGPIKQLRIKAQNAPAPVQDWFNDIADQVWALVLAKTKQHIDRAWQEQVLASYRANLQGRYPMSAAVAHETTVREFNRFFKPGGTEQRFVTEMLTPFVDTQRWQVRQLESQGLAIGSASLRQFRRADDIRRAYFAGGNNANMAFKIEPTKLDSGVRLFALELGENRINYSHGPRTLKSMRWTGGEDMRARIIFEDLNETVHRKHYEGDWSWLRLLDDSKIEATANNSVKNIVFEENGRRAEFRLIADTGTNPFNTDLLRNYQCAQML